MDFADLERKAADPSNKLLILCNPHNPIGRVWKRTELERLWAICAAHDVLILSDEIHGDIVYPPHVYTPVASLSERAAQNSFTFLSPAKTFNLAGMLDGLVIIGDDDARTRYDRFADRFQINRNNVFANTAVETAYREGETWLEALLTYLWQNIAFMHDYLREHIPGVQLIQPEGTYLVWLDLRGLGLEAKKLDKFLVHEAGLALNSGYWFGREGAGFARMNIGVPREVIATALDQLAQAVHSL